MVNTIWFGGTQIWTTISEMMIRTLGVTLSAPAWWHGFSCCEAAATHGQASLVRELWLVVQYFLASSLSLPSLGAAGGWCYHGVREHQVMGAPPWLVLPGWRWVDGHVVQWCGSPWSEHFVISSVDARNLITTKHLVYGETLLDTQHVSTG